MYKMSLSVMKVKGNVLKDKHEFLQDVLLRMRKDENTAILMSKMQYEMYPENVEWIIEELISRHYGVYLQKQRCSERGCITYGYYVSPISLQNHLMVIKSCWIDTCYQCKYT